MTSKLKIPADRIVLQSQWKCKQKDSKWVYDQSPTVGTIERTFAYDLPSGVVIKGANLWFNPNHPYSGISFLKVNGGSRKEITGNYYVFPLTAPGTSGTINAKIEYKANGSIFKDTNPHYSTLETTDVYVEIEYDGVTQGKKTTTPQNNTDVFRVPPQSVCIFDQEDGSVYLFDGVLKLQHALSVDIQEEPDKHKDEYINNARNQPDKLTLDVMMSDVYSGAGSIITKAEDYNAAQTRAGTATNGFLMNRFTARSEWTRSEAAFHTLHWLKEQRRKVSVITPQYVHSDMIFSTITVNQDDSTPFGWQGQIVLQHTFEPKKEEQNNYKKETGGDAPPSTSESYNAAGEVAPSGQVSSATTSAASTARGKSNLPPLPQKAY